MPLVLVGVLTLRGGGGCGRGRREVGAHGAYSCHGAHASRSVLLRLLQGLPLLLLLLLLLAALRPGAQMQYSVNAVRGLRPCGPAACARRMRPSQHAGGNLMRCAPCGSRSPHEDHVGLGQVLGRVGGEEQVLAAARQHHLLKSGLVDGQLVAVPGLDALCCDLAWCRAASEAGGGKAPAGGVCWPGWGGLPRRCSAAAVAAARCCPSRNPGAPGPWLTLVDVQHHDLDLRAPKGDNSHRRAALREHTGRGGQFGGCSCCSRRSMARPGPVLFRHNNGRERVLSIRGPRARRPGPPQFGRPAPL
jgi:hypothetical protein